MSSVELVMEGNLFKVLGELDKNTVPRIADSGRQLNQVDGEIIVDLAGVSRADSSGLAMLVHWMRLAREAGREIYYKNIPEQLQEIARVSDLDDILPVRS